MKPRLKAQARRGCALQGLQIEPSGWLLRRQGWSLVRTAAGFVLGGRRGRRELVLLAALAGAAPARAIDSDAGTGGAAFMKLGAGSPRAQALGRAYVALAEGPDGMVWNPAGVARAHSREVVLSVLDWVQGYGGQYLGYVHPLGRTVVGANFAYMSVDGFDVRDDSGLPLDPSQTVARNGFATLTFARSFFLERLFLGVSGKGVYEDNAGAQRTSFVGDVGALFRPNARIAFGAALQNVLNKEDRVVQIRRLGVGVSPTDFFTLALESSRDSDNEGRFGLGLEVIFPEELLELGELNLRFGYYSRDNTGQGFDDSLKPLGLDFSRASGLSFGVGVHTTHLLGYGMGIDYAYVPLGALGSVNQFLVRFRF